jgi:Xaa-Pro dipeptidase
MSRRHSAKIGVSGEALPSWFEGHTEQNRLVLGPPQRLEESWLAADLAAPDLSRMRQYRLGRLRAELRAHDCDGALLSDPVCVRYATDTTNMAIWTMRNSVRYAWISTDGPVIVFEFSHAEFLSAHSDAVDEVRPATIVLSILNGPHQQERADTFAAEILGLVDEHGRSGSRRVAVDTLGLDAIRALESVGIDLVSGYQLVEDARLVKGPDEVAAMRRAIHASDLSIDDMRATFEPGITEIELWAQLQHSNMLNNAEWMETRILASGARTNPWYHEASIKPVENGEIMAFDTDLIGAYGMCVDMSRSWLCGDAKPTGAQLDVYSRARDSVENNVQQFTAGRTYRDVTESLTYPPPEEFHGYTLLAHGVGMCDEYPSIFMRELWDTAGFDGTVQAGNIFSVEAFVGARSGGEGIKLEQMILVTENGPELLTGYNLDLI